MPNTIEPAPKVLDGYRDRPFACGKCGGHHIMCERLSATEFRLRCWFCGAAQVVRDTSADEMREYLRTGVPT